ncbi:MAG: hypothetical protein ABR970_18975 [Roseiarcus sp.]
MRVLSVILAAGAFGLGFIAPAPPAAAGEAPIVSRTKAECAAEYRANISAIRAAGQTKAAFDADCRAGTEKIPPAPAKPAPAAAKPSGSRETEPRVVAVAAGGPAVT